jgi:hypothetical protein
MRPQTKAQAPCCASSRLQMGLLLLLLLLLLLRAPGLRHHQNR